MLFYFAFNKISKVKLLLNYGADGKIETYVYM